MTDGQVLEACGSGAVRYLRQGENRLFGKVFIAAVQVLHDQGFHLGAAPTSQPKQGLAANLGRFIFFSHGHQGCFRLRHRADIESEGHPLADFVIGFAEGQFFQNFETESASALTQPEDGGAAHIAVSVAPCPTGQHIVGARIRMHGNCAQQGLALPRLVRHGFDHIGQHGDADAGIRAVQPGNGDITRVHRAIVGVKT